MKPTLDELLLKLEKKFGKLSSQAVHCAEDFHENYQEFIDSIQSNKIIIIASPNILANKLQEPKYTRYRIFGGLSIILIPIGLIFIFFNWKIGMGLILVSIISKLIGTNLKNSTSKKFALEITTKIKEDSDAGMFDICQYYIAGILQLTSSKGIAHLPLIPSFSLTGEKKYTRKNQLK